MLFAILGLVVLACASGHVGRAIRPTEVRDGTYEGEAVNFPNSAIVRVTVENGRLVEVVLRFHGSSWIGRQARDTMVRRILEQQSTDVDVVMGATWSSTVILRAVEDALAKARRVGSD